MNNRQMYALIDWVVERRENGWWFTMYCHRKDRRSRYRPYSLEASVALMVARQLPREIQARSRQEAA